MSSCVHRYSDVVHDDTAAGWGPCPSPICTDRPAAFLGNEGDIDVLVLNGVRTEGEPVLDNSGRIGELVQDGERVLSVPAQPPHSPARWRY
jgi:hypothetical protein